MRKEHYPWFLAACLVLVAEMNLWSQITWTNSVAPELTICGDGETFTVSFVNESGSTLSGLSLSMSLPTGIEYEQGSLLESSSYDVQESDVSDLNSPVFSMNDVPNNGAVTFTLSLRAGFDALAWLQGGNVFRNTYVLNWSGGADTTTTSAYNLLYAALTITDVSPTTTSVYTGGTFTRTVTIVNGGYGSISSLTLQESYNGSELALVSADLGTLNGSATELVLSSADFATIGDGDGLFEQNETIVITETWRADACSGTASISTQALWGCDGGTDASNTRSTSVSVTLYAPSLSVSGTSSFNTCMDGSADQQQIVITNNGSGPANDVTVTISQLDADQYSRIDINSVEYAVGNGSFASVAPTSTTSTYAHACLGANPYGGFTIALPVDIGPGESVTVRWDSYTCTTITCSAAELIGWQYQVSATDMCNQATYNKNGTVQPLKDKSFSIFAESPSDLSDGETGLYNYILSTATLDLPEGTGAYIEVEFDLPTGLEYLGNAGDLKFVNGSSEWTASSITYNSSTGKLNAYYDLPAPFDLLRSEIQLRLTLDCSLATDGSATVGMAMYYVMDNTCATPPRLPLTCYETATTYLHCPGTCSEGLIFDSFTVARTSLGEPDNDEDGLPDASGSLDLSKIKLNRVMVGDTFKTVFNGTIKTSSSYPSWSYAYARSDVPYGDYVDFLYATVTITKAGTGAVYTCSNVYATETVSNGVRTVSMDFSPATLVSQGCTSFNGLLLEEGDQVELTAWYKVGLNPGGMIDQATITNDFYVSPSANGTAYQCNDWNGNYTLIGYYFLNYTSEQYNIKDCNWDIRQSYYLSIGDCCTNYSGGNYFPYEYRNWAHPKQLRVVLPDGYTFLSATFSQVRTAGTNGDYTETASLSPASTNGQELIFDLESLYDGYGGSINLSDDGFFGTVTITVDPDCSVSGNRPMYWYYTFREADILGGQETSEYTSTPDYLRYKRANLTVSSNAATQDGITHTVSWDITVTNTKNTPAPNAWIFPVALDGAMSVTEVLDADTGQPITPVNGFYQLGTIAKKGTKNLTIKATLDKCTANELTVYSGYDCDGYAASLGAFTCGYNTAKLYVDVQQSQLQLRILGVSFVDSACSNVVQVEGEYLSSKLAAVDSIKLYVTMPGTTTPSVTIQSGSSQTQYPLSSAYATISDPSLDGLVYTYTTAQMNSTVAANGLTGITNTSANRMRMKFNLVLGSAFQPGQTVRFDITSLRVCGDSLPTLTLEFDPNAAFQKRTGIGLDDTYDNWAVAWGDYDNDGYVDLFVPTANENQPNQLYHNNGDGTFTKVTTGNIVTDLASSMAATWGDYDNDGDLDLFVSNNIGYANFLYRNNGDGTFTSIQNDPVVSDIYYSHGAAWADYDNDGDLDLFIAEYFPTKYNHLYRNNGDGTFTKVTDNAIILEASFSVAGAWGDYNNDGLVDLFVCNTNDRNNSLYKNLGGGKFLKINTGDIVNDGGKSVGCAWGDYDNDGDLDLFVANAGGQDNFLYRNNGDGTFTKVTSGDIVNDGGHSHGCAWGDYDNDGDLDLYVANNGDNDNFLYMNNGDGTFTRIYNAITDVGGESMGVAWADYDNDLDLDLFVANRNDEANFLFANSRGQCNAKACIVLDGNLSNENGIGAVIKVKANIYGSDVWQMRQVSSQTSGGTGGQNELKTLIGLGDATIIDSIVVQWPSGYVQVLTNQPTDQCITVSEPNGSQVCGTVFFDANGNCTQDADEPGVRNAAITITPGNMVVYTDSTGAYSIYLAPDTYTLTITPPDNWDRGCSVTSTSLTVSQIGSTYCGNDFPLTASCPYPDLRVEVASTSHRIGFENLIAVQYENAGTDTATNAVLTLTVDPAIIIKSATVPWDNYASNVVTWTLSSILPGERNTIYLTDSISTATTGGTTLNVTANITWPGGDDCNGTDNAYTESGEAVGALDPNDILVWPEGPIRRDEVLTYKIRFQNVGNALVKYVRVEDELPETLDPETVVLGVASHPFVFRREDHKLVWEFPNINMPDSTTNEPESHGFVLFQVQPRQDIEEGTLIENSARIFFDNMDPIQTNTVQNVIVERAPSTGSYGRIAAMPNPATDMTVVRLVPNEAGLTDRIVTLEVYNPYGIEVMTYQSVGSERKELDFKALPPGMYYLRALGESGEWYAGKVLIQ